MCSSWCSSAACAPGAAVVMCSSLGDVEEREEEHPNDVDEVPVDADELHALQLFVLQRVERDDEHHRGAGDDVRGVEAGGAVVEGPEAARLRNEAFLDLVRPLDAELDAGEDHAAEDGEPQEL